MIRLTIQSKGIKHTNEVYGAIIDALLSKSDVKEAREYFEIMKKLGIKPNIVIYTLLIKGYGEIQGPIFLVLLLKK